MSVIAARKTTYHMKWLVMLFMFIFPQIVHAQEMSMFLMPLDEADRDPTLVTFRDRMLEAVRNKEPERLVELIDFGIHNGLMAGQGIQAFSEKWRVDAFDTEIWPILEAVLKNGGGFVRSERGVQFCAPYVFTEFPEKLDFFSHVAVITDNAQLMDQPSSGSNIVADLSYHLLKINDPANVPDANNTANLFWLSASTLDGKSGFVKSHLVRSPADYQACFLQNKKGVWKMISFFSQIDKSASQVSETPSVSEEIVEQQEP